MAAELKPRTLRLYQLRENDTGTRGLPFNETPELRVYFESTDDAKAAAEVVFARVVAQTRAKLAAYKAEEEPHAAKRTWDNEKRTACFTETRITQVDVIWDTPKTRFGFEQLGRLVIHHETRHRWREGVMKTVVAKDGSTTITHMLGKASKWSAWEYGGESGIYLPWAVQLTVRQADFEVCTPELLAQWVKKSGEVARG